MLPISRSCGLISGLKNKKTEPPGQLSRTQADNSDPRLRHLQPFGFRLDALILTEKTRSYVCNPAIQFMLYEAMLKKLKKNRASTMKGAEGLTAVEIFLFGAVAKLGATVATYPLLVVKSRLQAKQGLHLETRHQYRGWTAGHWKARCAGRNWEDVPIRVAEETINEGYLGCHNKDDQVRRYFGILQRNGHKNRAKRIRSCSPLHDQRGACEAGEISSDPQCCRTLEHLKVKTIQESSESSSAARADSVWVFTRTLISVIGKPVFSFQSSGGQPFNVRPTHSFRLSSSQATMLLQLSRWSGQIVVSVRILMFRHHADSFSRLLGGHSLGVCLA
ncbi:Peroxisomal nicotinamide adenine dinucleotide carrier [Platanthera guangdongensis]|uniref:Peroxisomal nicotinamide adenine dinucleotide carrier n=1 Tax=Platanthera guangdongensis TaxID=2320717 RepID=A0ABR2M129_9ASPA